MQDSHSVPRVSRKLLLSCACRSASCGVNKLRATPECPALPVRPTRCTYLHTMFNDYAMTKCLFQGGARPDLSLCADVLYRKCPGICRQLTEGPQTTDNEMLWIAAYKMPPTPPGWVNSTTLSVTNAVIQHGFQFLASHRPHSQCLGGPESAGVTCKRRNI